MPDLWMDVDTALGEVPVNLLPLIDDTDFKTREVAIAYNAAGMDLVWNFVTTAGAYTQTAVMPTTGGAYDWAHQGDGMYSIGIPASGGASVNNDTEGFGWFTGVATGVLPWRGPTIGFRAAALNDALIDGGDLLDVNVTKVADTSQTARDLGASVLLSSGTGPGQVSLSAGLVALQADQAVNTTKVGGATQTARDLGAQLDAAVTTRAPASSALSNATWTDQKAGYLDHSLSGLGSDLDLLLASLRYKKILRKETNTWYLVVRDANDANDLVKKALKDKNGNEITDPVAGALAQELASSV